MSYCHDLAAMESWGTRRPTQASTVVTQDLHTSLSVTDSLVVYSNCCVFVPLDRYSHVVPHLVSMTRIHGSHRTRCRRYPLEQERVGRDARRATLPRKWDPRLAAPPPCPAITLNGAACRFLDRAKGSSSPLAGAQPKAGKDAPSPSPHPTEPLAVPVAGTTAPDEQPMTAPPPQVRAIIVSTTHTAPHAASAHRGFIG